MQKRKLGTQGLEVPAIGLGCMGRSWAYGTTDETESIKVLQRALEIGINFGIQLKYMVPLKTKNYLAKR
jgi:aryl-alcohol dehydrogenase-like predicted oxidoreductase